MSTNSIKQKSQVSSKLDPVSEKRYKMTYTDYLTKFGDSVHAEWVNGEVIVFMPRSIRHQQIVQFLSALISGFVEIYELREILTAPCEMRLLITETSREPDILVIAKENSSRVDDNRVMGPADLVVEVVSKESVSRDRSDKFYEYQSNGVREYWLIDPRQGYSRADFWVLDESGKYQPVPLDNNEIYHSSVLPNFRLNVAILFSESPLRPIQTLIEMVGIEALTKKKSLEH